MIRRHVTGLRLVLMSADSLSAVALFIGVSIVRFGVDGWQQAWMRLGVDPLVPAVLYGAVWVGTVWIQGLYRLRTRWSARSDALDLVRTGALVAVVAFAALFTLKLPEVSRLFLILLFPSQIALAIVSRLLLRLALRWGRERGFNARYMLIVGTGRPAEAFANRIERHHQLGLRVLGHLEWRTELNGTVGEGEVSAVSRPVLGDLGSIEAILHSSVVDEIAICLPPAAWAFIEPITRLCEDEGKIVRIPLMEGAISLPGARQEEFDGIQVVSLVYGPDRTIGLVGKRLLDIVLATLATILLSPLLAIIAILIRVVDGPPVLFRQERVGLHGRTFSVVKFRTMIPDAEAQLDELMEQNEIQGHAFKLSDDPRLSRTGRWLRRTSLDELPQLWNVLRGEMSLVGPRPPLPQEVAGYDVWHRRRLAMKPGITGLWQVSARREEAFDRWVELDLDYIDRWSLWLDLKIMVRTVPAMLQGR